MSAHVPRPYSLVKVTDEMTTWLKANGKSDSPLLQCELFIFLGEIPNMPTHCVIASVSSGKVLSGYHTDNFIEVDQNED